MPCHAMPCPVLPCYLPTTASASASGSRSNCGSSLQRKYLAKPPSPLVPGTTNRCARQETAHVEHFCTQGNKDGAEPMPCVKRQTPLCETVSAACQPLSPGARSRLHCSRIRFCFFARLPSSRQPRACVGVVPNRGTWPAAAVLVCLLLGYCWLLPSPR